MRIMIPIRNAMYVADGRIFKVEEQVQCSRTNWINLERSESVIGSTYNEIKRKE